MKSNLTKEGKNRMNLWFEGMPLSGGGLGIFLGLFEWFIKKVKKLWLKLHYYIRH